VKRELNDCSVRYHGLRFCQWPAFLKEVCHLSVDVRMCRWTLHKLRCKATVSFLPLCLPCLNCMLTVRDSWLLRDAEAIICRLSSNAWHLRQSSDPMAGLSRGFIGDLGILNIKRWRCNAKGARFKTLEQFGFCTRPGSICRGSS
jgi:hypothetical protein